MEFGKDYKIATNFKDPSYSDGAEDILIDWGKHAQPGITNMSGIEISFKWEHSIPIETKVVEVKLYLLSI